MKKYTLALLVNFAFIFIPVIMIGFIVIKTFLNEDANLLDTGNLIIAGTAVLIFIVGRALKGPLRKMEVVARREKDYDEFGRSKRKGNYEHLSREEQDAIDLQKTARMETILSTSVIKKLTHKGSEYPEEDMQKLIGLTPVKNKMEEMVARMQFEAERNGNVKGKKGKNKVTETLSNSGNHYVFYGSPGTGKAQPLYSKVLTPTGFVKMGDIKVGDTVIAGNGNYSKVLGVFPQGKRKIYEIIFSDGSSCRCSDEHLWKVQTRRDRLLSEYRIIETKDMLEKIHCEEEPNRLNYSVQTATNISFIEKEFFISPYIMGILIGDGCLTAKKGAVVSISNRDEEILNRIREELPEGLQLHKRSHSDRDCDYTITKKDDSPTAKQNRALLNDELKRLQLYGKYSDEKFIPDEYLYSSYDQRLALLQGLMDSDGTIDAKGIVSFSTTSESLVKTFKILIQSFGGCARYKVRDAGYKDVLGQSVKCRTSYNIHISFTDNNIRPFFVTQKAERMTPNRFNHKFIQDIVYIGEEECQCIYIDDPSHLYITDDFIVTHNTTVARILAGFLYKYGYIKQNKCVEIDGNFLKAGEDTALKTEMIIQQAFDGVLFIDEAYSLSNSYSGIEAIATLIKQMEDNRGRFVLILAGYTNEMKELLNQNPGFSSRIKDFLVFPDYDMDEMRQIFALMAREQGFDVDTYAYYNFERRIANEQTFNSFGNARTVRNVLDEAIDKHALNYARGQITPEEKMVIKDIDISTVPKNSDAM